MGKRFWLIAGIIAALAAFFIFSGCTLRRLEINEKYLENPEQFYEKTQSLYKEMTEEAFFTSLGFDPNPSKNSDLEFLDPLTIWDYVKGKSIFQQSEDFAGYTGYRLPFAKAKKVLSPTIYVIAGRLATEGHDLKLIGIFYKGKLANSKLEGKINMNERETIFVWDLFTGGVETGFGQGIREGIKAGL